MTNSTQSRIRTLESRQRKLSNEIKKLKQLEIEAKKLSLNLKATKRSARAIQELQATKDLLQRLATQIKQKQTESNLIYEKIEENRNESKNNSLKAVMAVILILGIFAAPLLLTQIFSEGNDAFSLTGAIVGLAQKDTSKPVIDIDDGTTVKSFGNVRVNFTVTDDVLVDSIWVTLKDGGDLFEQESVEINSASSNVVYIVEVPTVGVKQIRVYANDTSGNEKQTNWINIERLEEIPLDEFFGNETSDLTEQTNAYEIENFTVENENGKIKWKNKLNLVDQNVEENVNILPGIAQVDSNNLEESFNSTAEIVLYNRVHHTTPIILKNESNEWVECSDCSNITYYPELQEVHFIVPSFSSYTSVDGDELLIFDDSDIEGGSIQRYAYEDVNFFANYSDSDTNPITGVNKYCEISYNDTGTWTEPSNMGHNSSSLLYETSKSYTTLGHYYYNISCNSDTNSNLSTIDYINIRNSVPSTPTLLAPQNASDIVNRAPTLVWLNSSDLDGDPLEYLVQISNTSSFEYLITNTTTVEFNQLNTSFTQLADFDLGDTIYWRVQSTDDKDDSDWSETFEFNILALIDYELLVDNFDFGDLRPGEIVNTTDSNFTAFEIANMGNVAIDIYLNATQFFQEEFEDGNYSFMIIDKEEGSFESALLEWTTMSETQIESIIGLKYVNASNSENEAYIHFLVKVPEGVSAGDRSSLITISAQQSD